MSELYQIVAPHFVAGIVVKNNITVRVAPILHYLRGWPMSSVIVYCEKKAWQLNPVEAEME